MNNNFYLKRAKHLNNSKSITSKQNLNSNSLFVLLFFFALFLLPPPCKLGAKEASTSQQYDFFKIEELSKNRKDLNIVKEIQIKGFLYKTNEDLYILAAEPNLKSCCIGNPNKQHRQLIVIGNIPSHHFESLIPVTIEGKLVAGKENFPLQLTEIKIVEEENEIWVGTFAAAIVLAGIFAFWKARKSFA